MKSFKGSSNGKKSDAPVASKGRPKDDFESALDSVASGPARPRQRNDRLRRSFNDLRRSCEFDIVYLCFHRIGGMLCRATCCQNCQ